MGSGAWWEAPRLVQDVQAFLSSSQRPAAHAGRVRRLTRVESGGAAAPIRTLVARKRASVQNDARSRAPRDIADGGQRPVAARSGASVAELRPRGRLARIQAAP